MSREFKAWVAKARQVGVEDVLSQRGIELRRSGLERVGACPLVAGLAAGSKFAGTAGAIARLNSCPDAG